MMMPLILAVSESATKVAVSVGILGGLIVALGITTFILSIVPPPPKIQGIIAGVILSIIGIIVFAFSLLMNYPAFHEELVRIGIVAGLIVATIFAFKFNLLRVGYILVPVTAIVAILLWIFRVI